MSKVKADQVAVAQLVDSDIDREVVEFRGMMKIRWEEKQSENVLGHPETLLMAILIETEPSDGVSRNTVGVNLGSIKKRFLSINIPRTREFHQGLFWSLVEKNLDRIKMDSREKEAIKATIADRVPKPGSEWALWGVTCIPRFDT